MDEAPSGLFSEVEEHVREESESEWDRQEQAQAANEGREHVWHGGLESYLGSESEAPVRNSRCVPCAARRKFSNWTRHFVLAAQAFFFFLS